MFSGLFLLFIHDRNAQAQSKDSIATYIESEIGITLNTYYYSSFDSALFYLEPLSHLALNTGTF